MEEKIKELIETYEREVEFYEKVTAIRMVYGWVIKDLKKLLEEVPK